MKSLAGQRKSEQWSREREPEAVEDRLASTPCLIISGPRSYCKVVTFSSRGPPIATLALITWIRREFRCFRSKWPKIRHLSPKYLQQSLDFHNCSFSPPGVLVYESDGVSHSPTFG